jgi:FtsP/CotA-like multicopper oxidase with cupredoxin domain
MDTVLSRRTLLRRGTLGAAALGAAAGGLGLRPTPVGQAQAQPVPHADGEHAEHTVQSVVGDVGPNAIGIDPMVFLTTFDYGKVSTLPDGRTLREWQIVAMDREIEVAPGVFFPAWTYNGQVPGPTLRCTEGDVLRIQFVNAGSHPHTIHFHGFHPPRMDGFDPMVKTGGEFTYEFTARPFGLHPYHCHAVPLKKHLHKGLYGCLVIDPPAGRAPAKEFVMIMNGFDTNFDGENEIYAVNSIAFYFQKHPIRVRRGEPIRVYLTNLTEFDPINSFHLHASFFKLFRTGTQLDHHEFTDIVMMCQGERAVLEFTLDDPGLYMFHAHQSELAELGWMGFFESVDDDAALPGAATSAAASFGAASAAPLLCQIGGAS